MTRDRFEQQLPEALSDLATAPYPPYVDDVLAITATTPRRPAWQIPGRWLPFLPSMPGTRVASQLRPLAVGLALLLLLILGIVLAMVGAPRQLPQPFGLADNGLIAFSADGAAYVADTDGTTRLLFDGPGDEVGLTYSLDGTRLAFIRLLNDQEYLWAANADGTGQVQLLAEPMRDPTGLVWSPDGRHVAISRLVDGADRVEIVKVDGSGSLVLDLPFEATDPVWRPPDGRELVVRASEGQRKQLHVVAADGSGLRSLGLQSLGLMDGSRFDLLGAAWSPDGTRLAYHTVDDPPGPRRRRFQVHIVNADGSGDRIFTSHPDLGVQDAWPAWSPDGTRIATQRWQELGSAWLAVAPVEGTGAGFDVDLDTPFEALKGWATSWSPDGSRLIAFWDATDSGITVDALTGEYEPIDWPVTLTDRPSWQRVAPGEDD